MAFDEKQARIEETEKKWNLLDEAIAFLSGKYLVVGCPLNPPEEECKRHNAYIDFAIWVLQDYRYCVSMKETSYPWHNANKEKPQSGVDVLVCFSGMDGNHMYKYAYSVGTYWEEDGRWELDGLSENASITVHGWKEIEVYEEE